MVVDTSYLSTKKITKSYSKKSKTVGRKESKLSTGLKFDDEVKPLANDKQSVLIEKIKVENLLKMKDEEINQVQKECSDAMLGNGSGKDDFERQYDNIMAASELLKQITSEEARKQLQQEIDQPDNSKNQEDEIKNIMNKSVEAFEAEPEFNTAFPGTIIESISQAGVYSTSTIKKQQTLFTYLINVYENNKAKTTTCFDMIESVVNGSGYKGQQLKDAIITSGTVQKGLVVSRYFGIERKDDFIYIHDPILFEIINSIAKDLELSISAEVMECSKLPIELLNESVNCYYVLNLMGQILSQDIWSYDDYVGGYLMPKHNELNPYLTSKNLRIKTNVGEVKLGVDCSEGSNRLILPYFDFDYEIVRLVIQSKNTAVPLLPHYRPVCVQSYDIERKQMVNFVSNDIYPITKEVSLSLKRDRKAYRLSEKTVYELTSNLLTSEYKFRSEAFTESLEKMRIQKIFNIVGELSCHVVGRIVGSTVVEFYLILNGEFLFDGKVKNQKVLEKEGIYENAFSTESISVLLRHFAVGNSPLVGEIMNPAMCVGITNGHKYLGAFNQGELIYGFEDRQLHLFKLGEDEPNPENFEVHSLYSESRFMQYLTYISTGLKLSPRQFVSTLTFNSLTSLWFFLPTSIYEDVPDHAKQLIRNEIAKELLRSTEGWVYTEEGITVNVDNTKLLSICHKHKGRLDGSCYSCLMLFIQTKNNTILEDNFNSSIPQGFGKGCIVSEILPRGQDHECYVCHQCYDTIGQATLCKLIDQIKNSRVKYGSSDNVSNGNEEILDTSKLFEKCIVKTDLELLNDEDKITKIKEYKIQYDLELKDFDGVSGSLQYFVLDEKFSLLIDLLDQIKTGNTSLIEVKVTLIKDIQLSLDRLDELAKINEKQGKTEKKTVKWNDLVDKSIVMEENIETVVVGPKLEKEVDSITKITYDIKLIPAESVITESTIKKEDIPIIVHENIMTDIKTSTSELFKPVVTKKSRRRGKKNSKSKTDSVKDETVYVVSLGPELQKEVDNVYDVKYDYCEVTLTQHVENKQELIPVSNVNEKTEQSKKSKKRNRKSKKVELSEQKKEISMEQILKENGFNFFFDKNKVPKEDIKTKKIRKLIGLYEEIIKSQSYDLSDKEWKLVKDLYHFLTDYGNISSSLRIYNDIVCVVDKEGNIVDELMLLDESNQMDLLDLVKTDDKQEINVKVAGLLSKIIQTGQKEIFEKVTSFAKHQITHDLIKLINFMYFNRKYATQIDICLIMLYIYMLR